MMAKYKNCNQSGFVLIYVLSMVVLIASALVLFQTTSTSFTKRIGVLFKEVDSLYMAYSPIILTSQMIKSDTNQLDGMGDTWYRFYNPQSFPVDNGSIKLMIRDAGSVPDINSLFTGQTVIDDSYIRAMQEYFGYMGVPKNFAGILRDWIDADNTPNRFGGTELPSSVNTFVANKNIVAPADVKLVKGYSEDYSKLLGVNLSYLPRVAPVNINTIDSNFLSAIFAGKSARVNYVVSQRKRKVFKALGAFYEALNIEEPTKAVEFGVETTYFTTYAEVNINGVVKKVEALFERRFGKIQLRRLLWN